MFEKEKHVVLRSDSYRSHSLTHSLCVSPHLVHPGSPHSTTCVLETGDC